MTNVTGLESPQRGRTGGYLKARTYTGRGSGISSVVCDSSPIASSDNSAEALSPRQKSPKPRVSRGSPTILGHYAGAKFSDPPAPAALPPPPPHWTLAGPERLDYQSHQLKLLLNVQA